VAERIKGMLEVDRETLQEELDAEGWDRSAAMDKSINRLDVVEVNNIPVEVPMQLKVTGQLEREQVKQVKLLA
jgi:hypothetical protein